MPNPREAVHREPSTTGVGLGTPETGFRNRTTNHCVEIREVAFAILDLSTKLADDGIQIGTGNEFAAVARNRAQRCIGHVPHDHRRGPPGQDGDL